MLKLKDISSNTSKIYNESDYYVTIKLLFEKTNFSDGVCYWNAYGKESSLVQIGLSNPTGAIYKIVSFFHHTIRHKVDPDVTIMHTNVPKKIGLPLFETYIEKYQEGYYHLDEKIDFEIYTSKKNTTIIFSSNTVVLHVINDLIIFGFDNENNLCYIHMKNMVLEEEGMIFVK
ncbi:MAG TPA: hypothetical protein VJ201_07720 [Candidatus Babeliales bacterium]|nr:hypothetical protein [Candidatus Babeliales bacterium]HLC07013.1 hypothetical protein [Candidatus Babeliales bacterium]